MKIGLSYIGKLTLLIMLIGLISCAYGQDRRCLRLEGTPSYVKSYDAITENKVIRNKYKFIDATDYLPKGFVKDGTKDYTSFIQLALNSTKFLLMPDFPVLINDKGLDIQSDQIILFQHNSKLKLEASSKTNYEILRIKNKRNIKIYSPVIEGDRDIHLTNIGEWGMGISIVSSSNILIVDLHVSKCWGDGIYIGQDSQINNNIVLKYGVVDNNRRNGISVISVNGLDISNFVVSNSNGTNPQAGLDFEPNSIKEDLKSINISDSYFFNNKRFGIIVNTSQLINSAKTIDLILNNVKVSNSETGFAYVSSQKKVKNNSLILKGEVNFINADAINVVTPFKMIGRARVDVVDINIKSPKFKIFKGYNDRRLKISK